MRPKAPKSIGSAELLTLRHHTTGQSVIDSRVIPLGIFPEQIRHDLKTVTILDPQRGEIIDLWI